MPKDEYVWDYHIKIKTKEGTFDYEKKDLSDIDLLLERHPSYEEVQATHIDRNKPKTLAKTLGGNRNGKSNKSR